MEYMNYCCEDFKVKFEMGEVKPHPIKGYMIEIHDQDAYCGHLNMIRYCPWCGAKLE